MESNSTTPTPTTNTPAASESVRWPRRWKLRDDNPDSPWDYAQQRGPRAWIYGYKGDKQVVGMTWSPTDGDYFAEHCHWEETFDHHPSPEAPATVTMTPAQAEAGPFPPDCSDGKCHKCRKCFSDYVEEKMSGELDNDCTPAPATPRAEDWVDDLFREPTVEEEASVAAACEAMTPDLIDRVIDGDDTPESVYQRIDARARLYISDAQDGMSRVEQFDICKRLVDLLARHKRRTRDDMETAKRLMCEKREAVAALTARAEAAERENARLVSISTRINGQYFEVESALAQATADLTAARAEVERLAGEVADARKDSRGLAETLDTFAKAFGGTVWSTALMKANEATADLTETRRRLAEVEGELAKANAPFQDMDDYPRLTIKKADAGYYTYEIDGGSLSTGPYTTWREACRAGVGYLDWLKAIGERNALTAQLDQLRAAIQGIRDDHRCTIKQNEDLGPTWTDRKTGDQLYDASYVLAKAQETIDSCTAALSPAPAQGVSNKTPSRTLTGTLTCYSDTGDTVRLTVDVPKADDPRPMVPTAGVRLVFPLPTTDAGAAAGGTK